MSVKLRTLACWMGWPPPLMQPPGQAMNSTKSYWREPSRMPSSTRLTLCRPEATQTRTVLPGSS